MTVFVDDVRVKFRGMVMSHLWADSVAELHEFADRLGLKREWFQAPPKASWEHYDVSEGKREQAIRMGAVATDRYGAVEHVARREGDTAKLAMVARARAQRDAGSAQGSLL